METNLSAPEIRTWLVWLTFVSQTLVFSFWAPYSERRRIAALEARFPRDAFALAYRSTGQKPPGLRRMFMVLNVLVGLCGIGTIAWGVTASYDADAMSRLMLYALCAQLLVLVIDASRALVIRRELRRAGLPVVRTAELRPRRIEDYAPTWLIVTALSMWTVCAAICVYVLPKLPRGMFAIMLGFELINVWMLLRIVARLRGRLTFLRADPYMTPEDRRNVGQLQTGQLFRLSIVYSILIAIALLGHARVVHVDAVAIALGFSLYLQVGLICLSLWLRKFYANVDFTAYRVDTMPRPTRLAGAQRGGDL